MKTNLAMLACLGLLMILNSCEKAQVEKPNIIFIMSDDHAAHAIGAYGSRLAGLDPTPNLDQLAEGGMLFENAFCTNSICVPSRATIMTGQYSQTNGILDLDGQLPGENQYLPMEMKKMGYSTAIIGKYHLHEEPTNFDYYKVLPGQGNYFNPDFREKGQGVWPDNLVPSEGHSSDVITDFTIQYLENRDLSKPFFLMHHYKAPHDMFEFAPRYAGYLEDVDIPEPASMYSQPEFGSDATRGSNDSLIHYIGTSISPRHKYRNYTQEWVDKGVSDPLEATHQAYQEYLKRYLRCVKGVDDNLGRLFDYLKKEGLWENTVIIYTGDQGMMLGEHDYQDKRWMYEESMRMPFIVHYPGIIEAGSSTDLLINNSDYAPTMLALAGGEVPQYMQGMSFLNTLKGEEESDWRTSTYYRYWMHIIHHYVPAHFGIRTLDYKLIFYYGAHYLPEEEFSNFYWGKTYEGIERHTPPVWEFYDLKKDPQEMVNRIDDPAYQEIIAGLKMELQEQREELNETDEDYPVLQQIIKDNWNSAK